MPASSYHPVEVLLGSESDYPLLIKSKLKEIFDSIGIKYGVNVMSADRTPRIVRKHAHAAVEGGTVVFIAAASMTNVLATAVANVFAFSVPVIGVALPGGRMENDSLSSLFSKPDGCPVIPVATLTNAAIIAAQIIGAGDLRIRTILHEYQCSTFKEPIFDVDIAQVRRDLDNKEKK